MNTELMRVKMSEILSKNTNYGKDTNEWIILDLLEATQGEEDALTSVEMGDFKRVTGAAIKRKVLGLIGAQGWTTSPIFFYPSPFSFVSFSLNAFHT